MEASSILMIVVILVLLYFVIYYLRRDVSMLQESVMDGTLMTTIQPTNQGNDKNNSGNFAYSVWFYVNDWNYKYGELKFVFARMGGAGSLTGTPNNLSGLTPMEPCPAVTLDPLKNNLNITMTCYSGDASHPDNNMMSNTEISNIPIQRWVNLLFSVYGRTLDVYIDGKLVRTSLLPGIAHINQNAPTYLTPLGGFYGWTSKFQYWSSAVDPQKAWNVYSAGYGGSMLSALFGKYQVKVSLLTNGKESSSIQA